MLDGLYDIDGNAKPIYINDSDADAMTDERAVRLIAAQKLGCSLILRTDRTRDNLCHMLDDCARRGLFFFTIESAAGD
jgi:hypothetical protein